MTQTILHIDASARREASGSRQLGDALVSRWLVQNPDGHVVVRDSVSQPLPYLDEALFSALMSAPDQHTRQQAEATARLHAGG